LELSELIRKGNQIAFKEIYDRYNQVLFLFAFRKLQSEAEAMDVVHDVFAWLLENSHSLHLKSSLSGYLYRSVLHKIFDIFRKQDTFKRYINEGQHFIDMEDNQTDFLIREKDIREQINNEIAAMPPRMREVYELKYREQLNAEQIGEKLGISPQTVQTHLKRGNKHLRNRLGAAIFIVFIL